MVEQAIEGWTATEQAIAERAFEQAYGRAIPAGTMPWGPAPLGSMQAWPTAIAGSSTSAITAAPPAATIPVSYTHLTLPTNREV